MVKFLFLFTLLPKQSNRQGGARVVDLPVSSFDLALPGVASPLMMNDDNWMKRLITECSVVQHQLEDV